MYNNKQLPRFVGCLMFIIYFQFRPCCMWIELLFTLANILSLRFTCAHDDITRKMFFGIPVLLLRKITTTYRYSIIRHFVNILITEPSHHHRPPTFKERSTPAKTLKPFSSEFRNSRNLQNGSAIAKMGPRPICGSAIVDGKKICCGDLHKMF